MVRKMMILWEKHKKKAIRLLWAAVILASIKSIFTDTGFDNAYTVAMSFRHLRGDGMFEQMWEPHQTSIFFTDFFMWIYRFFVPSYAGVMLYLQVVGTVFFALIGIWLYRLLKDVAGSETAQLATMFFIMFRAKQTPFPEYANLQIAFSTLLFLCLVSFVREQQKRIYLCLAAVFLCLEVLAYPSCLLAWILVVWILFRKTEERWRNIGLFTGICALFGGVYVGYFVCKVGLSGFLRNLANIFFSDSHSKTVLKFYFGHDIAASACWLLICAAFAVATCLVVRRLLHKSVSFLSVYGLALFLSEFALLFLQKRTGLNWTFSFQIIPAMLMVLSCFFYRNLDEQEKTIWLIGNLFAASSFLATWMLTDLNILFVIPYMALGGVVSLTVLRHRQMQASVFVLAICALVTMHRGLAVWGYANADDIYMVQDVQTIVRSGAFMGVACDYRTKHQILCNAESHDLFLLPQDSLFLVGNWPINSMEFLVAGVNISNPSTINSPVYNEKVLDYLGLYPEKSPTVVAVQCIDGKIMVKEDAWIMKWISENYEAVGDGKYWRYFREKNVDKINR